MSTYLKITVNVPVEDAQKLRDALGSAGAGRIGNYKHGSFSTTGIGRGIGLNGAHPTKGKVGVLEEVEEEKIETLCKEEQLSNIIKVIKEIHPYEEPIIIYYPVEIVDF